MAMTMTKNKIHAPSFSLRLNAYIFLTKPIEASKSQKKDSKFSTKTKTMTMPFQNLFRYSSLEFLPAFESFFTNTKISLQLVLNLLIKIAPNSGGFNSC